VPACASTKPPAPLLPEAPKKWKKDRGNAGQPGRTAIAPMNQGCPANISCCSGFINVIYIFFDCGVEAGNARRPGLPFSSRLIHPWRSTARMDNPAEFVAPCWNSGLSSPPKLTRHSLLLCVDTKESSYPKLPSCKASLRHTAVPVRLTAGVCRVG
jgi:hypothetical protein